ncbi:transporter [Methylobacter sp.]|uniref:transporter n=1 Tax=Methylobacter sp. TaxID=2051955 RepID=UPI002486DA29|nr:transporter [Methylobacter sp.]MDI1278778.1 transporter [Methylobacter sp.]MDI1359610.1 transporter [Methylobacter sp.]
MIQPKKTPLAIVLSSAFALYSGAALADHGSLGFGIGTASPIITQPGVTLPTNMWAVGTITQFSSFNSASDQKLLDLQNGPNPDVHSVSTYLQPSIFAAYGLTDDLTFGVKVPYVFRTGVRSPAEIDLDNPDARSVNTLGDPNGFGDVSIFTQYRFFHTADNLNHVALTLGLKTPTGQTALTNNQGTNFETHHQPGSGSWNPSAGISYTRVMGSFSFDTNAMYTIATRGAQGTYLGDNIGYNIALSYAFGAPARNAFFSASNNAPWTAVLEFNGERQAQQRTAGVGYDANSGGNTIYVSPGVRYSGGKNWNTALSIGTPIVQDLNGYQTPAEYRITYRFVVAF